MAANDRTEVQVAIQNAEKVFVSRTAVTVSQAIDLTATNDANGLPVTTVAGGGMNMPMLVLQSDADFYYNLTNAAGTSTAANSVKVLANQQEYVCPRAGRRYLNVLSAAGTANVSVFVVRT